MGCLRGLSRCAGGGVMAVVVGDGFLARLSVCRARPEAPLAGFDGLRFAFYGRMSTSVFQDVQTSRAWQRAVSDELIDGIGSVVAEFLDVGVSRRWSWQDRPEAATLLAAAVDPRRDFDAVVVGEIGRAHV